MASLALSLLALPLLACSVAAGPAALGAPRYPIATAAALLEFRAKVGLDARSWKPSRACDTWAYTICDSTTGALLELNLSGLGLEGNIPDSFYSITTLQKLDLSNNSLWGGVDRYLADINKNLYYLDLSNNMFSGNYPDIWTSPDIYKKEYGGFNPGDDPYYKELWIDLSAKGGPNQKLYINLANTYFNGYQTFWVQAISGLANFGAFGCVGNKQVSGSINNTCITTFSPSQDTDIQLGNCAREFDHTQRARRKNECLQFCGAGADNVTGVYYTCNSIPGSYCKPASSPGGKPTCVPAPPSARIPTAVQTDDLPSVDAGDLAALNALSAALGNPTSLAVFQQPSATCASMATSKKARCDSTGRIASLNISGMGFTAPVSTLTSLLTLTNLQELDLSFNKFYGDFYAAFSVYSVISGMFGFPKLTSLNLANNTFWGLIPTNFPTKPRVLNLANNFFSGGLTVTYFEVFDYEFTRALWFDYGFNEPMDVPIGIPAVHCPVNTMSLSEVEEDEDDQGDGKFFRSNVILPGFTLDLSGNCLAPTINPGCTYNPPQKSASQCAAMCGIAVLTDSKGRSPLGPCQNGDFGQCVLNSGGNFACTGVPPPQRTNPRAGYAQALRYFADRYIAWGTPASVFADWNISGPPYKTCSTPGKPGTGWKGLTCAAEDTKPIGTGPLRGDPIALDLKGVGLVGPFPQPSIFEEPFWNGLFTSGSLKYFDISNNKLYGPVDPVKFKFVLKMDYLDASNNNLTGPLPEFLAGQFQYFNFSNNYFTGSPTVLGIDNATVVCPSKAAPVVDLDGNCFNTTYVKFCSGSVVPGGKARCGGL